MLSDLPLARTIMLWWAPTCISPLAMYILWNVYLGGKLLAHKVPTYWWISARMLFGTITPVHTSTLILPHPCLTCCQNGWEQGIHHCGYLGSQLPTHHWLGAVPAIIPSPFRNWLQKGSVGGEVPRTPRHRAEGDLSQRESLATPCVPPKSRTEAGGP